MSLITHQELRIKNCAGESGLAQVIRQRACPIRLTTVKRAKGDAPWPEWTPLFAARETLAPNAAEPIARPNGLKTARAAPPISGIAWPATTISRRWRFSRNRESDRRPDRRGSDFKRSGGRLPALLADRQFEYARSIHAAAGRSATVRRHARARWCARSKGRARRPAASSMLRASSPRTNGSSMTSLRASEMPGPSSSTSMVAVSGDTVRRTVASRAVPDRVLDEIGDAAMQVVGPDRGHGVFAGRHRRPCVPCRRTDR